MAKPQTKSKVAPREVVLDLGMYASGAGALTRVANLMGAAVPPLEVGGEGVRQGARRVFDQTAAGDVGEALDELGVEDRLQRFGVDACWR